MENGECYIEKYKNNAVFNTRTTQAPNLYPISDPNRVGLEFNCKNYRARIPSGISIHNPSFDMLVSILHTTRLMIVGDKAKSLERTARNIQKSNLTTKQISEFYMRYDDISEVWNTSTHRDEHIMRGNYLFRKVLEVMGLSEEASRCQTVGKTTLKNMIQCGWRFLTV